jgi:hypothetical protein
VADLLLLFLDLANELLAAAIVILAVSLFLYNITRNFRDRVARTSGVVLLSVTITYIGDVFVSLQPSPMFMEAVGRLQFIGITLIPTAIFHLSDALLDTTGLPSRGRRRRVVRMLYLFSFAFMAAALFSDALVVPVANPRKPSFDPAALFYVFVAFFVIAGIAAYINVDRARRRCLTRNTRSRMAYLQAAILAPALAIFPYSILFKGFDSSPLLEVTLVNIANGLTILMLLFISYPLSFFGSRAPDRVVKAELLRFVLRGPATAGLILGVIVFIPPSGQVLGLPGDEFTPFAAVTVVLLWQWVVDIALPWLERRLIYRADEDQFNKIQELTRQLLTRDDLLQLLDAILEAGCEHMRANRAFVISNYDGKSEIVRSQGAVADGFDLDGAMQAARGNGDAPILWNGFVLLTLYSLRTSSDHKTLIGVLGVEARGEVEPLAENDEEKLQVFRRRAARTLDDLQLQGEIYAALEGLLPQFMTSRENVADLEFRPGHERNVFPTLELPDREQVVEQVGAALRHYWGGPGMTQSRLLEWKIVRDSLADNDNNPVKALRAILDRAIEIQKPEGERDYRSQEWMIYNILHLRFIKKRLVRDTARMLYISDANLYRKQNLAIEAVADTLIRMERELSASPRLTDAVSPPAARADSTPHTADQPAGSPAPERQ